MPPQQRLLLLVKAPASLVSQKVKNPPAVQKTWVRSLGWEDPLRKEQLPTPVFWPGESHGLYSPWGRRESARTERPSLQAQPRGRAGASRRGRQAQRRFPHAPRPGTLSVYREWGGPHSSCSFSLKVTTAFPYHWRQRMH